MVEFYASHQNLMKILLFFFFFGYPTSKIEITVKDERKNKWLSIVVGLAIMFAGAIVTGGTFYTLNYFIPKKVQCCQDTVNTRIVNEHSFAKDIGDEVGKEVVKTVKENAFDKMKTKEIKDSSASSTTKNKFKTHTK